MGESFEQRAVGATAAQERSPQPFSVQGVIFDRPVVDLSPLQGKRQELVREPEVDIASVRQLPPQIRYAVELDPPTLDP